MGARGRGADQRVGAREGSAARAGRMVPRRLATSVEDAAWARGGGEGGGLKGCEGFVARCEGALRLLRLALHRRVARGPRPRFVVPWPRSRHPQNRCRHCSQRGAAAVRVRSTVSRRILWPRREGPRRTSPERLARPALAHHQQTRRRRVDASLRRGHVRRMVLRALVPCWRSRILRPRRKDFHASVGGARARAPRKTSPRSASTGCFPEA